MDTNNIRNDKHKRKPKYIKIDRQHVSHRSIHGLAARRCVGSCKIFVLNFFYLFLLQKTKQETKGKKTSGKAAVFQGECKQQTQTNSAKTQQSTAAQHHTTAQHHRTQHKGAGHRSKPHQPQGSRPHDQTGTAALKHATRGRPRTTRPSTAPQHTTGNSTTLSNTPHRKQRRPHEQHNASRPAQRSTAPHGAERAEKAQHDT